MTGTPTVLLYSHERFGAGGGVSNSETGMFLDLGHNPVSSVGVSRQASANYIATNQIYL